MAQHPHFLPSSISFSYHSRSGDGLDLGAVELVGLVDGILVPVRPVHPVLKQGHTERVFQVLHRVHHNPENQNRVV